MEAFPVSLLLVLVPEQHRIRGPYVLLVVVMANNLHIVETELDFDPLIGWGQKTEGVQGKLKLWTDTHEDAALCLNPFLPAELESQDMSVLIRLIIGRKKWNTRRKHC